MVRSILDFALFSLLGSKLLFHDGILTNSQSSSTPETAQTMFRPPILRNAANQLPKLDRAAFTKRFPISAARVSDPKTITKWRDTLTKSQELLRIERVSSVGECPASFNEKYGGVGQKLLLLEPRVDRERPETWSEVLKQGIADKALTLGGYDVELDYAHWTYLDVMKSLLPEDAQEELPVGFTATGQVAHLNIRNAYLPYRYLIAHVLMDKNPAIKTVINKIDTVGEVNPFRTFSYEVLAGPDDLNVEIKEEDCTFRFDFAKVYWNSRLSTEHRRLVNLFNPGEVVVDLMAGVGPFAVPAGKKGVFVWANDLNPDSVASMRDAIKRNKASNFVRAYNEDGHKFMHQAAAEILSLAENGENKIVIPGKPPKVSRNASEEEKAAAKAKAKSTVIEIPRTISHFVMNLPASALTFLSSFRGLYHGKEELFEPNTEARLPMVHVHCFGTKSSDNVKECHEITGIVNEMLGAEQLGFKLEFEGEVQMQPGDTLNKKRAVGEVEDGRVRVHDVRDVAPLKRMFCASFRLPREVAFAKRS